MSDSIETSKEALEALLSDHGRLLRQNVKLGERIAQLQDSMRELCNLVMVLADGSKDEALKEQAERVVKRVWERMSSES